MMNNHVIIFWRKMSCLKAWRNELFPCEESKSIRFHEKEPNIWPMSWDFVLPHLKKSQMLKSMGKTETVITEKWILEFSN